MDVRRNVRRRRQQRLARFSAAVFGGGESGGGDTYEDGGKIGGDSGVGEAFGGDAFGGEAFGSEAFGNESFGRDASGGANARSGANGGAARGPAAGGFGQRNETPSGPPPEEHPGALRGNGTGRPAGAARRGDGGRQDGREAGLPPVDRELFFFGQDDRERLPVPPADPEEWWKQRMKRRDDAEEPPGGSAFGRLIRSLAMRTLWALVLFGAVWGWLRLELPGGDTMRKWLSVALHEDMDVEAVRAWYEATFAGSPAFLPLFRDKTPDGAEAVWGGSATVPPVEGRLVETFGQNGNGVRFAAPAASSVRAVYAGLVMQVVRNEDGASTILIRHPNHVITVYGQVDTPTVRANDWVEAGQTIGRLAADADGEAEAFLDFAVRQNGRTLDPAAVIPLD